MEITIEISNWGKFNGRPDVKHPKWMRIDNDIYASGSLFGMTPEEKWAWICILGIANEKGTGKAIIRTDWFEHFTGVKEKSLLSALKKLEKQGCVTVPDESVRIRTDPEKSVHDETRRDETDETQQTKQKEVSIEASASPPFDACYPKEFSEDPVITEFLERAKVKPNTVALWLHTYQDPGWLRTEFLKMVSWLSANGSKKPKTNYARFIGNWLSRGWETHRKALPSLRSPNELDWDKIKREVGA